MKVDPSKRLGLIRGLGKSDMLFRMRLRCDSSPLAYFNAFSKRTKCQIRCGIIALQKTHKSTQNLLVDYFEPPKSSEPLTDSQGLSYNFIKIHSTLWVTPAMAVGVTDQPWSDEDLAALWET